MPRELLESVRGLEFLCAGGLDVAVHGFVKVRVRFFHAALAVERFADGPVEVPHGGMLQEPGLFEFSEAFACEALRFRVVAQE